MNIFFCLSLFFGEVLQKSKMMLAKEKLKWMKGKEKKELELRVKITQLFFAHALNWLKT
jgi:hypothetical protein